MLSYVFMNEDGSNWLTTTFFPMTLQSDVLFEALVYFVLRNFASGHGYIPLPRGNVRSDYSLLRSNIISKLRQRFVLERESVDDITILTVLLVFAGEVSSKASHT